MNFYQNETKEEESDDYSLRPTRTGENDTEIFLSIKIRISNGKV